MRARTAALATVLRRGGRGRRLRHAASRECITDTGEAPTVREIGQYIGLSSVSAVHYQLRQCEEKGAIAREPWRPRGIRLAR
ncbi:hypothetical protein ACFU6I_11210 [Streptomyces sp. NPDC057486]|uniref:LexA family protein n=1 Tax=Streptomyces sp. NPDC057486 TaxID=3346145 RepID=UPI00369C6F65